MPQYFLSTLSNLDKPAVLAHLMRLNTKDRYMRFFAAVSDYVLEKYVEKMDLNKDASFGIYDCDGVTLIAFAHVGAEERTEKGKVAELGISVELHKRGLGLAKKLMSRTLVYCRANNIGTLYMSCLRENKAMQHLAKENGLSVVLEHDEAIAELALDGTVAEKLSSIAKDLAFNQISIFDKCYRQNSMLVRALMGHS